MKKIAYIIPYFGKLPVNFPLWLISCEKNPTIDWLLFTDDHTDYSYPANVKVFYMSFNEMKAKIQRKYEFQITLDKPWKLCDFRVAYGEIFCEELVDYDFWGHCDIDLLWGDIRAFLKEDILDRFEKIGDQGHSTIYKNSDAVNSRYRIVVEGFPSYKEVFSSSKAFGFDESLICNMYKALEVPYYHETIYAHLNKYESSFYLGHMTKDDVYKNKRQIFIWKDGKLTRYYLKGNVMREERFMYIHFWCRPITYRIDNCSEDKVYIMYPDIVREYNGIVNAQVVRRYGHQGKIKFLVKALYRNRKKITLERIIFNLGSLSRYRKRDVR